MPSLSLNDFNTNHPLYKKLETYGLPHSKTEQYRNFPIKPILADEYTFKKVQFDQMKEGKKLLIENGAVVEYPKGVKVLLDRTFEADQEHFDTLYFASHMLSQAVIYLEVTQDLKFEIQHIFNDKTTLLSYRIVINVKENIQVEVFESFQMQGSQNSFFLYGIDSFIEQDATMLWIRYENRKKSEAKLVGTHKYAVAKQGAIELKTFDYGSASSLHLYKIDLEDYAWLDASHLLLATKDSRRGNVIQANHNKPYAKSVQEARSILKDTATGIFDAKICVTDKAPYSNASQNSKAILLDENAHMYAKPQLEIYIDELEASHGSTIGTLDEDALFYLSSRGIKQEDAQRMLVLAFANSLIHTIKDQTYSKKIHEAFEFLL
ncbi:SufD family Fe-S cluster assembly protein [Sulfurimonas sp.]|nr:SufD family Fe-S cluster assembly protein [Sulfurimonas sp.]